jgi:hypothetical protein
MTYRVINLTTGEIEAELGDFEMAKQMAENLADGDEHKQAWCVVEMVTRYCTDVRPE